MLFFVAYETRNARTFDRDGRVDPLVEDDPRIHVAVLPFVARCWDLRRTPSVVEADAELEGRQAAIVLLDRNLPGPSADVLARHSDGGPTTFFYCRRGRRRPSDSLSSTSEPPIT